LNFFEDSQEPSNSSKNKLESFLNFTNDLNQEQDQTDFYELGNEDSMEQKKGNFTFLPLNLDNSEVIETPNSNSDVNFLERET
jgi:hypothetical protein